MEATLGTQIAFYRKDLGLTQEALAEQLGVKPSPAICALYEQALGGAR